jgi:hypothetical protein
MRNRGRGGGLVRVGDHWQMKQRAKSWIKGTRRSVATTGIALEREKAREVQNDMGK